VAKLKIGIIGVGGIAQSAHIPGYKAAGDQVELVACADVNYERANRWPKALAFAGLIKTTKRCWKKKSWTR